MRQTVTSGSAHLLNDLSVQAAAKTGTAEVAGQENPNAWASVFAPYEDPELVIVVLVENAGEGSAVSIPIAKEALENYFNKNK
jgi:penicillin-binding protein 2